MLETFEPWLIAPIASLISILVGLYFYRYVENQDSGTDRMREISDAIRLGARAFLKREYTVLFMFVGVVAVLLLIFLPTPIWAGALDRVRGRLTGRSTMTCSGTVCRTKH